ncbi:putative O-glycosylation ligase, exosortase A system-associated [Aromatoleum evansii]|uniref:O-glycosylation ligase, exosortase A system-associated n=1 Tax=Aromatoleum evansii TaxID=59406 RepID=A0ABZ1AI81_AROEV|nr:putative O-glycosylation ligase, exosortase A system-associated [Aromatoleum evansii]
MRDIAVTLAVFGTLPFILRRPWIGILVWTWLGFMNPHRMAWGFSMSMPFAQIVAITTFVGMMLSSEPKRIPWERETKVLLAFVAWMTVTTIFAVYPSLAWEQFEKVIKIQLMIIVAMVLINTPERLKALVWTIALSLAFYGVKGGIFTIMKGGVHRVQGPPGTFIEGNNELGLALAMTVPLLYFLARGSTHRWIRPAVYAATVLTALAAIGTQSRGALVGMAVMGTVFWLKARHKFLVLLLGAFAILMVWAIMPEAWYQRMATINTYQEDASAMGRINAWWMAFNLACDRLFGGGFETFRYEMFHLYAPDPTDARDVHSIYFEVLGEHGFVGLFLFLLLAVFTWRSASIVRRAFKDHGTLEWMSELMAMVQVSLVAYLAAGAFLGMAYFDYYYNLILIVVVARVIMREAEAGARQRAAVAPAPANASGMSERFRRQPERHSVPARAPAGSVPRS